MIAGKVAGSGRDEDRHPEIARAAWLASVIVATAHGHALLLLDGTRRDPRHLLGGDALDFWRVEAMPNGQWYHGLSPCTRRRAVASPDGVLGRDGGAGVVGRRVLVLGDLRRW